MNIMLRFSAPGDGPDSPGAGGGATDAPARDREGQAVLKQAGDPGSAANAAGMDSSPEGDTPGRGPDSEDSRERTGAGSPE